jgi:hypothetical protein
MSSAKAALRSSRIELKKKETFFESTAHFVHKNFLETLVCAYILAAVI